MTPYRIPLRICGEDDGHRVSVSVCERPTQPPSRARSPRPPIHPSRQATSPPNHSSSLLPPVQTWLGECRAAATTPGRPAARGSTPGGGGCCANGGQVEQIGRKKESRRAHAINHQSRGVWRTWDARTHLSPQPNSALGRRRQRCLRLLLLLLLLLLPPSSSTTAPPPQPPFPLPLLPWRGPPPPHRLLRRPPAARVVESQHGRAGSGGHGTSGCSGSGWAFGGGGGGGDSSAGAGHACEEEVGGVGELCCLCVCIFGVFFWGGVV